jgi:hypothetical protein
VDLDHWLDTPVVRTRHARASPVDADALWAAAASVRLRDCRLLGRLIRARIPGLSAGLTFHDMFRDDPFIVLDEGPAYLLSGLLGRIWTVRRDFTVPGDPDEFRRWQVPGTARVLFASWAEPGEGGGSTLVSEVRVAAVDRRAALYIRGLGPFIAAFQGLIGVEPLAVAEQRAR